MYQRTTILFLLGFTAGLFAQNPHGADLNISCAACHSSEGWEIDAKFWQGFDPEKPGVSRMTGMVLGFDTIRFHHGKTRFELKGRHNMVDCRACHESLIFSEAGSDCIDCHEHDNPVEVANDHQGVSGYQYSSTACYNCHPDGSN